MLAALAVAAVRFSKLVGPLAALDLCVSCSPAATVLLLLQVVPLTALALAAAAAAVGWQPALS